MENEMIGQFNDLAYDIKELNKVLKKVIEDYVPNPDRYTKCFHPYEKCKILCDYLGNLEDENADKNKELIQELLKRIM